MDALFSAVIPAFPKLKSSPSPHLNSVFLKSELTTQSARFWLEWWLHNGAHIHLTHISPTWFNDFSFSSRCVHNRLSRARSTSWNSNGSDDGFIMSDALVAVGKGIERLGKRNWFLHGEQWNLEFPVEAFLCKIPFVQLSCWSINTQWIRINREARKILFLLN